MYQYAIYIQNGFLRFDPYIVSEVIVSIKISNKKYSDTPVTEFPSKLTLSETKYISNSIKNVQTMMCLIIIMIYMHIEAIKNIMPCVYSLIASVEVPFPAGPWPWSHPWRGPPGFIFQGCTAVILWITNTQISNECRQHGLVEISLMSKFLQNMLPISHLSTSNWQKILNHPCWPAYIPLGHSYKHLVLRWGKHGLYEISMHMITISDF